ncbi:hypothetical protein [Bifidobacterium pseudocatenulatum]|uniref:hypothetical protein n=1 Tax=Bifidobacterium pseudocatenulatum TaxID=28026 RepID=UPI00080B3E67|nr:hypothetical protein [Bifidobacterium pseudocatenulatum]MCB4877049.1 hypothetical protein [Bifidobacterium pseudocatenulatum]
MSDNINWNETAICDFLRFEHKPELQAAYDDRNLTKLANAGLVQRNEERHTWTLTQKGEKKLADIRQHFNSGKLSELPLTLRHYYFDWSEYDSKNLPVNALYQVAMQDKSAEIRRKTAELLDKYDKLDKETSNALSHDKDWEVRYVAAKKADVHNFFKEDDVRVVKNVIGNHDVDKDCLSHWLKSPYGGIRVQAALLSDDSEVDEVFERLEPEDVARVLGAKPRWATREIIMKAWGAADGWERRELVENMRDMPDSFINQAFKGEARWTLRLRMEDYRKAVRQVLELGAMFSEDSEIRRKIWERAKREI